MKQGKLKQIRLNDKLTIKTMNGIEIVNVTEIIAEYPKKCREDKIHTAHVDSISAELFQEGLASIKVDADKWIPYCDILQSAQQPLFIEFVFDKLKRNWKNFFIISI